MTRQQRASLGLQIRLDTGGYNRAKALARVNPNGDKYGPPNVTRISLGGSQSSYNKSGAGRTSTGQAFSVPYRNAGDTVMGPNPFAGLKKHHTLAFVRFMRPLLWKANPWLRGLDLAMTLYDLADQLGIPVDQMIGDAMTQLGWVHPGRTVISRCGPGVRPFASGWPACGVWSVQTSAYNPLGWGTDIYVWGKFLRPAFSPGFNDYFAGVRLSAPAGGRPVRVGNVAAVMTPGISLAPGVTAPIGQPSPSFNTPPPKPPAFVRPTPHAMRPPGKRVKEQKLRAQGIAAKILGVALESTEYADFVDSLYEALPFGVQLGTVATGRVSASGWRPGTRYVSTSDKTRAILRNWERIDWNEAARNLIANQVEDAIIGKLNKGAQDSGFMRQQLRKGLIF